MKIEGKILFITLAWQIPYKFSNVDLGLSWSV